MTAAVIDVGTNSIKLVVGEREAGGPVGAIAHATTNPRLGEGVDKTHEINPQAMDRAIDAISQLLGVAREHGADSVRIAGTSAMRDARNRDQVIERVRRELGVELEVLPEEEECRYSYLAVALDPVLGGYSGGQVVADVGGGSSELTFGIGGERVSGRSVRIGAVRLTERYLSADPPSADDIARAAREAEKLLSDGAPVLDIGRAVGIGGSAVNLARVLKGIPVTTYEGIHGTTISRVQMAGLIDALASRTVAERKTMTGLEPERADILLGGAIVLNATLTVTGAGELVISTRGLRFGILYEMLELQR